MQRGTELHDFACQCIRLKVHLPKIKRTLNMYANDALQYSMTPEQPLYFSRNCFGTADAIAYNEVQKTLRIHDLKTGSIPAHMEQLQIYAALFCLEYDVNILDISVELRIYQNDEIIIHNPEVDEIVPIMDKIITSTKLLETWESEGL